MAVAAEWPHPQRRDSAGASRPLSMPAPPLEFWAARSVSCLNARGGAGLAWAASRLVRYSTASQLRGTQRRFFLMVT